MKITLSFDVAMADAREAAAVLAITVIDALWHIPAATAWGALANVVISEGRPGYKQAIADRQQTAELLQYMTDNPQIIEKLREDRAKIKAKYGNQRPKL